MRIRSASLTGNYWAIPIACGAVIALTATLVLRLPYVWSGLLLVGLAVAVGSLIAQDFKSYWMAVFALALPLEIIKSLVDGEYIREITNMYGIPMGEMPAPFIYLSDLPFIILLLHWMFEVIYKKQKVYYPKSNRLALVFIGWCALSLINTPVFSYGFYDLLRLIKFYFLYIYIANNITTEERVRSLMRFFFIGVAFQGVICLIQFLSHDSGYIFGNLFGKKEVFSEEFKTLYKVFEGSDVGFKRASGTVGPINAQAQYFELLLPVLLVMWLGAARLRANIYYGMVFMVGAAGLIVTFSRGGFIGLAAGLVAGFFLSKMYSVISGKKFLAVLITSVLIITMASPYIYKFVMSRPEASQSRFHLYKVGLKMIEAHPFLGVGLNSHMIVSPQVDTETYFFPTPTHNQYIFMASEVGVPGLAFFLAFITSVCVAASRVARSNMRYLAMIALGILGAIVAIAVHSLVDHFTYHTNLSLLWLFAGLSAAMYRLTTQEQRGI